MSGAAFFRHIKLTGSGIILKAARHNKRAIQAELGADGHIDPKRSNLNFEMIGPQTAPEVVELFKQKLSEAGIASIRKNQVLGIEVVFSLPAGHNLDLNKYFTACAEWVGAEFGGMNNILSFDVHLDEGQDHAHLLLIPIKDSRLQGSDMMGGPKEYAQRQMRFYESVSKQFGFNKPRGKLSGQHKKQITKQVLAKLSADQASKSSVWAVIRDAVDLDPLPYALALGIELEKPKKPMKTMAQIFTGTGKGPKHEKPIGFQKGKDNRVSTSHNKQTLAQCRVSQPTLSDQPPTLPAPTQANGKETGGELIKVNFDEVTRIRDNDLDPKNFDPETGEFYKPAQKRFQHKERARQWVNEALQARKG